MALMRVRRRSPVPVPALLVLWAVVLAAGWVVVWTWWPNSVMLQREHEGAEVSLFEGGSRKAQHAVTPCSAVSVDDPYSNRGEDAASAPSPTLGTSLVFTSYFTSAADPQRRTHRRADSFAYIRNWYMSIQDLHIPAVVFHDGLSYRFQEAVEDNSNHSVIFEHVKLAGRSTNDARFYHYRTYLEDNPCIQFVVMTDISDVVFQHDPFPMMEWVGTDTLLVGRDMEVFHTMRSMNWMVTRVNDCFADPPPLLDAVMDAPWVFNAGVIGGHRRVVLEFLRLVTFYLDETSPKANCNMAVVNYVLHRFFAGRMYAGPPFTSRFRMHQAKPRGVFILHK